MGGVPLKSPSGRRPGKVARRSKSRGPQAGAEVLSNRCSANLWLQAIPSRTLFATVRAISPPPPVRGLRRQWRINGSAAQPATSQAEAETASESRRVALQPDAPTAVAQADVLECGAATWPAVSTVARRAYVRTARCAAHGSGQWRHWRTCWQGGSAVGCFGGSSPDRRITGGGPWRALAKRWRDGLGVETGDGAARRTHRDCAGGRSCGAASWSAVSTVARQAHVRTVRRAAHGVAGGGTGARVGRAAAQSFASEAAV